jgi:hypothetical protein
MSVYVSIRPHTPAYTSIRQHTPQHTPTYAMYIHRHRGVRRAYVSIRQHTSAYVSIRQHTSAYAYVSMDTEVSAISMLVRSKTSALMFLFPIASLNCCEMICLHTSACVSIREVKDERIDAPASPSAYVSISQHTSAYASIRQQTSAVTSLYSVSLHMSAYVNMHQHT